MQTLASLLVIVAAACAIARPSGPTAAPAPTSMQARDELRPLQAVREGVRPLPQQEEVRPLPAREDVGPLPAREEVRPLPAREGVGPLPAREQVVRLVPREQLGPLPAQEQVRRLLPREELVPIPVRGELRRLLPQEELGPFPAREEVRPLLAPAPLHILLRRFLGYHEDHVPPAIPDNYWLNEEINRISQIKDEDGYPYNVDLTRWLAQGPNLSPILKAPHLQESIEYGGNKPIRTNFGNSPTKPGLQQKHYKIQQGDKMSFIQPRPVEMHDSRKSFALTPLDNGYFETDVTLKESPETMEEVGHHEGGVPMAATFLEPQRQIRQNPNLSKQKHLLGPQLVNVNSALSHKSEAATAGEATERPPLRSLEQDAASAQPAAPAGDAVYGVAILAVVGAALATALVGFAFGCHTLSKKAKAAANADYPAYGVTGPTIDTSGDRKLAHSAHMYHYQHQKQQIIAMERNGMEQQNGSISDPESEEENEEGDYTVYECPGFATTGEMEVANPLFSEDPMVATPGKCETAKPQRKE